MPFWTSWEDLEELENMLLAHVRDTQGNAFAEVEEAAEIPLHGGDEELEGMGRRYIWWTQLAEKSTSPA